MVVEKVKVTIDLETWLRGGDGGVSRLLRSIDQKKCCLGFVCLAIGFTEVEISDITCPANLHNGQGRHALAQGYNLINTPDYDYAWNTGWVGEAMSINDDAKMPDLERQNRLTELFAANGFELEFV